MNGQPATPSGREEESVCEASGRNEYPKSQDFSRKRYIDTITLLTLIHCKRYVKKTD